MSAYGTVAITGDAWMDAHAQKILTHGLPPLPPTVEQSMRNFNPTEARDGDGKWTAGPGGAAAGALKDALKLAEKIDLDPGEQLMASSKIDGDSGGIRMALTHEHGHSMLRLGIGGEGYGQRNRDEGIAAWDGNPTRASLSAADRQQLGHESDALDAEYDSASPARQAAIEDRQAAIREQLSNEGFNGTAKLDQYSMGRLADRIRPAMADALDQEKAENSAWDQIEAGGLSADRSAELHRLTDRVQPITFTEGVIPGSAWGDVHYAVELDDPSVGVQVILGVKPKNAPDSWGEDLDWRGKFDTAEARKFLRLLDQYRQSS
jgi:hypothetical protein